METQLKLRILCVIELNHFIVREYETNKSDVYNRMENILQRTYSTRSEQQIQRQFKVGSYVAVYCNAFNSERSPKVWMRGVVRENCGPKEFLWNVYSVDHGFEKTFQKSDLRQLEHYFFPSYVPFQAFHFYLTGVDQKEGVNRHVVENWIQSQFEANMFVVSAIIERRDGLGNAFGSICLKEDVDLAAVLIIKSMATDVHFHGRNQRQSNSNENEYNDRHQRRDTFRPQFQTQQHFCKCDAIVKYRRKELLKELKQIEVQKETALIRKFSQSI